MYKNWKRWGALLLALVMALSLLPTAALAATRETSEPLPTVEVGEEIQIPSAPEEWAETPDLPENVEAPENVPIAPVVEEAQATLAAVTEGAIAADYETRDIPTAQYTVIVSNSNSETHSSEGPKAYAIDNDTSKFWHSDTKTAGAEHWIGIGLTEATWVSAFRYLPRTDTINAAKGSAGNGFVTEYRIDVSMDGQTWTAAENGTGTWEPFNSEDKSTGAWQVANFTPVKTKYIRLVGVHTICNTGQGDDKYMHANEIRVVAAPTITASGTISGRVVDVNGDGVQGATVTLAQDNVACTGVSGVTAATTDASGNYSLSWSLTNAAERCYKVRASKAGYGATLSDAVNFTGGGAKTANVTLTAITADKSYDMTGNIPAYTNGQNASVREESDGLEMTFGSNNRLNNLVRLTNITGTNTEVEFDATRSGSGVGGFGIALRHQTGIYIYAGQNTDGSGWCNESVNSGTTAQSAVVQGPSFASGETRHFRVQLQQSGGAAHVSLWIDGVAVMEEVPAGSDVTALGALAFICGVPGTTVTVQNLYVTSHDEGYTITMPDTLKGCEVISATEVKALVAAEAATAAEGTGTFKANPGDIINIYSATPLSKTMTAPLTVKRTADNTVSSVENILHITHTNSANKELGYYVQFQMPAYNVTLVPGELEEVETSEIKSVSILRSSGDDEIVNVGGTATLRATLTPAIGVEDLGVTWSSSDEAVATVEGAELAEPDKKGADAAYATATVTGHKKGTATITVTTSNGLTDTRTVTVGVAVEEVNFPTNTEVTLYTNGKTAAQRNTVTLTPVFLPEDATNKALSWWSSAPEIASVTDGGVVTAVAPGEATIYARSQQNTEAIAERTVRVVTLPEGLTLDVTAAVLTTDQGTANNTQTVIPTLTPEEASNKTIVWSTSNSAVATVTRPWSGSQNAQIAAQGVGEAIITARSAADSAITATVTVTVTASIAGEVSVSGEGCFDSELTVETSGITTEGAAAGLTYQWYRGEETTEENAIAGATGSTYTPVEEDIDSALTVKVTATGYYAGELTCTTEPITRAPGYAMQETPTYVNCSAENASDGKITGLYDDRLYEYQPDTEDVETGTWTPVTEGSTEITGLAPGTYRIRRAGDDTHLPGSNFETVTIAWDGAATYGITIPSDQFENGDVTANLSQATEGAVVTLTAASAIGYEPDTVTVTYTEEGEKKTAEVTQQDGGKYTFTMPAFPVNVAATFKLKTYTIVDALTNITCSLGDEAHHIATHGERFTITLEPETGYVMPTTLTVTETASGQKFTAYTYTVDPENPAKRVLTFARGVTQSVTVTGAATPQTFPVECEGENVSFTGPNRASWHQAFAIAVAADAGYELPDEITVTMNDNAVDFTYNKVTGAVSIAEEVIEGSLKITVTATKSKVPLDKVSISGVAREGKTLTANITPAEAANYVNYQWYWLDDGVETLVEGATGRTRQLNANSVGHFVFVKATAMDESDFSGVVTSQPTGTAITANAEETLPTQVQLQWERVSVEAGATVTMVASVFPAAATNKTISWSSSDESVATVVNGVITGVAPGRAVITVTTEAGEGITDTCTVTVIEPRVIQAEAKDVLVAYDGLPHGIAVAVTKPDGGAAVQYSRDGLAFRNNNPTFSTVGEYTVWYRVTADDLDAFNGQAKVTITKAKPVVKLTSEPSSLSEAGEITLTLTLPDYVDPAGLSLRASDPNLSLVRNEDGTYTVSLPDGNKTYTFTASLVGTDDYESVTATCTVRVGVATSNPAVPVISTGTTDDGFPTTTETKPDGTKVETTEKPDGTKEIVETKADGTVTETTEKPDGTKEAVETKPDGTVTETTEKPDGTKEAVETKPDGTVTETKIDAEGAKVEKVTDPEENVTITATDAEGETVAEVKVPAVIPEAEKRFEDVPVGHWADEAIHKLAAIEVVNGVTDTQYSPVVPMKRGDLATVLFRLSNGKEGLTDTFADVESGKYYADGIAWAAKAGVVEGYSDTEFRPEQTITREQLALMLMRYAKLLGVDTSADAEALNAFADGGKTSSWAVDGVAWCVKAGIIQGMDDVTLSPNTNVSRAQVAVMLQRFIDLVK